VSLKQYDLYRVLREENGGTASSEEEWNRLDARQRSRAIELLAERFELTDAEHRELTQARGGCRCQDPGAMPPCGVCTEPPSLEEIEGFALVRRAGRQPAPVPALPEGWGDW